MKTELIVKDEARKDIAYGLEFYSRIDQSLGDDFLNAIDEALEKISHSPEMYAIDFDVIRQVKLRRFPYVVSYLVEDDRIYVLAVLHGHRDPREWQRRK